MITSRAPRQPRLVTLSLMVATGSHLWAALNGLGRGLWIPSWHWAVLGVTCLVLCAAAWARPELFRVRDFRIAGVMTVALAAIILVPLPGLIRRYGSSVPRTMVLAIAAGVMTLAIVFFLAPRARPRRRPPDNERELVLPAVLMIVAIVLLPVWLASLGSVPVIGLFTGQASGVDLAVARYEALRGLQSVPLRLAIGAMRNLYLMFAVGWMSAWFITTPRSVWRVRSERRWWLVLVLGVAVTFALATTERAIFGQVIVAGIIAGMVAARRPLTTPMFALMGAAVVAFPLVFGFVLSGGAGGSALSGAIESVRRRLFFVPGDVMIQYFASFPERRGFLHGASIPKIQLLFGGSTFDLSGYIYEVAYRFDDRFTGNANGTFLGVGWANFGLAGVVGWSAAVAVTILVLERLLLGLPRRTAAALRAMACIQGVLLTSADLTRTLLNIAPGFLDLVVVALILSWLERRRASHPAATVEESRLQIDGVLNAGRAGGASPPDHASVMDR